MSLSLRIRPATDADHPELRRAIVALQEHERGLHASRLPGEQMADDYLAWMQGRAEESGATLVAEMGEAFAGFVSGWIEEAASIAETPDSNRTAFVSDIFVAPGFRGRRIAAELLDAIERRLARPGITRMRLSALATNEAATRAYRRAGFSTYEVVYERPIARPAE